MTIPVILLNYNSTADCRKCIGFLKAQRGVELEIIVVDNASRPEEAREAEELCKVDRLTFIPAGDNRGYNAGNNIGLRYASSKGYKYALIANPDMEFPDTGYVSRLVEEMESYPQAVVAGSAIVTPEGVHQHPMLADGDWTSSFGWIKDVLRPRRKGDEYGFIGNHSETAPCRKLSGCALMVRMDFIEHIGFFDEYPFLYCEEAILSRQVENCGMVMRYVADTQAVHRHIPSAKGDPRPRFRQWRRSRLHFIRRYSGYPWYGRLLAGLSWRVYTGLMCFVFTLKKK